MSKPETQSGEPINVRSADQFERLISEADVALVDYHAEWCGPCKMLEPTVEELAAGTDATVLRVDIDELQTLAQSHGIQSVPTLQFYAGGEPAKRVIGVQEKGDLLAVIEDLS